MRCAALIVVVSLAVTAPATQRRPRNFQTWVNAVTTHAPGERDDAEAEIAPWSIGELDSVLADLRRQPHVDQLRLIERGLVLHADIAILNRETGGYNLPSGEESVTLFSDGRAVGLMSRTGHWEFARRLLDRGPAGGDRLQIGRQFYRASAAVLQLWGEYPELTTHLSAGRDLVGDDAVLLMYEGTMRQAYAGPRVQRFFDERRREQARERPNISTTFPPSGTGATPSVRTTLPEALPSAGDSRARAEQLFRRALAIDPALAEARIRLGHVLGDRGRHEEAAAELERATKQPLPLLLDYYAALLIGREARVRGQLQAARTAFERAARLFPNASAPRYGLSELAIVRRDGDAGLALLLQSDAAARIQADEPWWWLDRAHDPSAATLISELRRHVTR